MRLRPTAIAALMLSVLAPDLAAQGSADPRIRIGFGVAGGRFRFEEDGSRADGETRASLVRVHAEATTANGIGGGIRFESVVSDDDLFDDAGFTDTEATQASLFVHFTYRIASHRFAMPVRIGFLLDELTLEEVDTDTEVHYGSAGFRFELAPELLLVRRRSFAWSLFAEFGAAATGTTVEVDGDRNDYESGTGFLGLEAGTRLRFGNAELGLSYVGRWQGMDESDEEDGFVVLGYDARFQGVLLAFAIDF
ncbi:MAG: hypothetical protein WAT39_00065 [Planctomycetota bacterium]